MLRQHKKYGQSFLEFMVLIMIILTAYLIGQKYIVRAFSGRWKSVGDSLGQGRIYDPQQTLECAYDFQYTNSWYRVDCYDQRCADKCLTVASNPTACSLCIGSCAVDNCQY